MTDYYKVLGAEAQSIHGGEGRWHKGETLRGYMKDEP